MSVELIVFPDVELLVQAWLEANGVPEVFVGKLPADLPAESVFVRRTGGLQDALVRDLAQVTIEARAKITGRAERLAARCRALVSAAARVGEIDGVPVHDVREFTAPYLDPDPVNPKFSRYSATYQVAVRGAATAL